MSLARFRTFRRRLGLIALLGVLTAGVPAVASAAVAGDSVSWFHPLAQRFGPDTGAETATGVAVRSDGRIVASIVNDAELDRRIVGLLPDGTLDPSFSGDGVWHWPQANVTVVRAVAAQSDGKVVFVGDDHSQHAIVVGRLMRDGELDPTFGGGDGFQVYATGDATSPYLEQVLVQGDGKIVFAGSVTHATKGRELLIGRLNADGSDDGTFNGAPYSTFGSAADAFDDRFAGMTRLANGEFILASAHDGGATAVLRIGPAANYAIVKDLQLSAQVDQAVDVVAVDATHVAVLATGTDWPTAIARVDVGATPALDTTFGGGDGVATPFPSTFRGVQLLAQPDGKFVVAGFDSGSGSQRAVVRLDAAGGLDPSFGTGGMRVLDGSAMFSSVLRSHEVAFGHDGAIVSASHVNASTSAITAVDRLVGRISRLRTQVLTPVAAPLPNVDTAVVLRVTNDGPDASGGIPITFAASSDLQVLSTDGPCTLISATQGTCQLADLAPGTSRDITIQVRRATEGTGTVSLTAHATTFDDDQANDTSQLGLAFALPGATATGPAAQPGFTGPKALLMTIRRVTTKGGTQLRCGFTGRFACATARVRTGVRTVPLWIRARSTPLPGTWRREVRVVIQRLEKGRYVRRGTGTLNIPSTGFIDVAVPNSTRSARSYWRWRVYAPATPTTLASTSRWFYILVK